MQLGEVLTRCTIRRLPSQKYLTPGQQQFIHTLVFNLRLTLCRRDHFCFCAAMAPLRKPCLNHVSFLKLFRVKRAPNQFVAHMVDFTAVWFQTFISVVAQQLSSCLSRPYGDSKQNGHKIVSVMVPSPISEPMKFRSRERAWARLTFVLLLQFRVELNLIIFDIQVSIC